jgi:hypothetical protein
VRLFGLQVVPIPHKIEALISSSLWWTGIHIFNSTMESSAMAEWRKVAKALALGDGYIDEKEVGILRKELFADGKIDKSELDFLYEIKRGAATAVKALDKLIEDCEKART